MFGKSPEPGGEGKMNTIIGKGSIFNGQLKVEGAAFIDGTFEGTLEVNGSLIVGKNGVLKAEIKTKDAVIGGKILGNITAANKIELQSGAHLAGEVKSRGLIIDDNVFFEGSSKMIEKPTNPEAIKG
ncbi:MAG: polymer-forming cytoskeletal protein [Candidatus Edwardsbacteria bacterium]